MAVVRPKTIIITQAPGSTMGNFGGQTHVRLATQMLRPQLAVSHMDGFLDDDSDNNGPRKRRRLTNLSPEERMMRRKLKNRVAAQTARDRKKERMDELEQAVAELQAENTRLQNENDLLYEKTDTLSTENVELRQRLGLNDDDSVCPITVKKMSELESAEGIGSGSSKLVDTRHSVSPDSKPDVLYGLLNQIGEDSNGAVQLEELPVSPGNGGVVTFKTEQAECTVVGPTTAELESLNELIQFDHIYYKVPHPNPVGNDKPVQSTIQIVKKPVSVLKKKTVLSSSAANVGQLSVGKMTTPVVNTSSSGQSKVATTTSTPTQNVSVPLSTAVDLLAAPVASTESSDNTASDGESIPLDLPEDVNLSDILEMSADSWSQLVDLEELLSSELKAAEADKTTSSLSDVKPVVSASQQPSRKRKLSAETCTSAPKPKVVINTPDLTDLPTPLLACDESNLFGMDSFVSVDSASESGYGSDHLSDVGSPQSISSALHDDMWEESFTELFPSLL